MDKNAMTEHIKVNFPPSGLVKRLQIMREILFRGKRTEDGEWVYGFFWKDIWGDGESCYILYDTEDYPVIPSTVGQYTGLTDKNGVKIFKGDVIMTPFFTFVVCFKEGCFGKVHTDGSYIGFSPMIKSVVYGVDGEVIGNIHDNPQLWQMNLTQ